MAAATDEYQSVLNRARAGNQAAIAQLVQVYGADIRLIARARLGSALRPILDSVDVVQSVHRCVMLGLRGGTFDVSTPEKLVAVAVGMVRIKIARHWRRLRIQERSKTVFDRDANLSYMLAALISREDNPAHVAELKDQMSRVSKELSDFELQVVQMRLDGHNTAAVARELGLDADMLRVQLGRLRKRLCGNSKFARWF